MRSPHSGLIASALFFSCFFCFFFVIRGGHWGGFTACDGGVCVRGDWSPPVKSVADKFLVFTHYLSGFWLVGIGFSAHLRFLVWVVWLFYGWPGLSGVSSWFTVSCVVWEALLSMLAGNDG